MRLNAGPNAIAEYVSGGNDGVLTFLYTVSPGDESEDLDADGKHALVIPTDASIEVYIGGWREAFTSFVLFQFTCK